MSGVAFGGAEHLERLARVMALTNKARLENLLGKPGTETVDVLLSPRLIESYRAEILGRPAASRGTTHISVADAAGNVAGLTSSNGEGCGTMVAGTGIMLNNMLGEEDLNPGGFHLWKEDTRMASMMAPTLVTRPDGKTFALGSGGSNRLRTAILQVLVNLLDFRMAPEEAVEAPRIHVEQDLLSIEGGFEEGAVRALGRLFPENKAWESRNLFFGGVNLVDANPGTGHFHGVGDPRRGGSASAV